jgi:hypothetical protein
VGVRERGAFARESAHGRARGERGERERHGETVALPCLVLVSRASTLASRVHQRSQVACINARKSRVSTLASRVHLTDTLALLHSHNTLARLSSLLAHTPCVRMHVCT